MDKLLSACLHGQIQRPEMQAMMLDGELTSFGETAIPTDSPPLPAIRARVVVPLETTVCGASGQSALWIRGLARSPEKHSVFLVGTKRANHAVLEARTVRSLKGGSEGSSLFDGVFVRNVRDALVELLNDSKLSWLSVSHVLSDISISAPDLLSEVRSMVQRGTSTGLPTLAAQRLAFADSIDVVDSVNAPH